MAKNKKIPKNNSFSGQQPKDISSENKNLTASEIKNILQQAQQFINQGEVTMDQLTNQDVASQAEIFKTALEKAQKDSQLVEQKQQELDKKIAEIEEEKQLLDQQKQNYQKELEQFNQEKKTLMNHEGELLEKEKDLSERELNAEAGFLTEKRQLMTQLENQIQDLRQEREIIEQEKNELSQNQTRLNLEHQELHREQDKVRQEKEFLEKKIIEINEKESNLKIALDNLVDQENQLAREQKKLSEDQKEFEINYQYFLEEKENLAKDYQHLQECQKRLKRQENDLQSREEMLKEDQEMLEEKVEQKSTQKLELLKARIFHQKQQLDENRRIREELQKTIIKKEESERKFGNKNAEEVLTELSTLRKIKEELEVKLASKPSDIATEKLAQLESQQEQWERERFSLKTELQELKRNSSYSKMAVTEVETLRDEKESLQVSNERLKNALEELRKEVSQEIENSKNTSPFQECVVMDNSEKLKTITPREENIRDLKEFAEDLRYRIAISSEDKAKILYYSAQDIRIFLGGLAMSRLHLLEGISGTGKTSLAINFSRAVNGGNKMVEIQAGWRDRQDLIGYYNAFEKRFYESEFLQALYEAQCPFYQDRIYIIVLDEMNLSRPEQYFADFLSKIEQDSPTLSLATDLNRRYPALFEDHKTLKIPNNVWFIGTANQDETTVEFADKTYDRAHIMELGRNQAKFEIPELRYRHPISYQGLMSAFKNAQNQYQTEAKKVDQFLKVTFANLLEKKFKIGWGNRLEKQIGLFIPVIIASGGTIGEATDHLLATKILRKIKNRYDIPASYLRELKKQLTDSWSDLDGKNYPVKSLKIIDGEIARIEPEA